MRQPLLIVGASVRAAAESAAYAGYAVTAVDLFGDVDLRRVCTAVHVAPRHNYPFALADLALALPASPWMYTGGLENYPDLVDRISLKHTLLGNAPAVLRAVRDPGQVFAALGAAGHAALPVVRAFGKIPPGETWLQKPLRSSGGEQVRIFQPAAAARSRGVRASRTHYFQRYQPGRPASAAFLARGARSLLLGVSEQLLGAAWGAPAPFMYAGSIGPLDLSAALASQVQQLGQTLVEQFHLVGLFGVDGVLADETFWPVEVNPRYTASLEVLRNEAALSLEGETGSTFVGQHVEACTQPEMPPQEPADGLPAAEETLAPTTGYYRGKAICYATAAGVWPATALAAFERELPRERQPGCGCADRPRGGTAFAAGDPVCTLLAEGRSPDEVRSLLATLVHTARNVVLSS